MPENNLLDGKATALAVREDVAARVAALSGRGVQPGLAVVLVGEDPASQIYVRNKDRAASQAGIAVQTVKLSAETSQEEILEKVEALNADSAVHGILVQLPLPKGIDEGAVVRAILPEKDVDGLHPDNIAALVQGQEGLVPCTPAGCIELLDRHGIDIEGKHVVVVGRSMLVGKPVVQLMLSRNATVTTCHSRTRDLARHVGDAEILIAAVGVARLIQGDWIRPGAVVLDVGINRGDDGKLVGDVDFGGAVKKASAITPVPGGIGPMTIAMLLSNTVLAAARQSGLEEILAAAGVAGSES
jgi:methylenetetrahydrofolate dehydrogenase (NADP+) / methenyltetrahydrofolate cyclohydrolase